MATINPYLTFDGNCEEAFNFYKSVFGGDFPMVGKFGDMPAQEGMPPLPEDAKNRIMHITLPISTETILMGSDTMPGMHNHKIGNNISLSINTNSKEEADKIFEGLSEGGVVTMPLNDTFWGAYFGMWTDKFGINWMVNYDDPAKVQAH
ncbi:VOC family protein [Kaistella flava (ex Peng et al. 2021)]|uniref:VOC family protein n=1 Tax=Kaistella flava (ex Peng et al. 2021) TaxID=2038776 RepID=A0A7M2Y5W9_9FLAO|nr:VOC family protein [Kaistella flava (ex Peng et al. 2021)]QOW09637.1 VOC family protein [Kaistella flava (ex Peng et al. 2021)]